MISVFEPRLSIKDKLSVTKTLFQNQISGTSPVIKKFEEDCSKKFDREYSTTVSNGSVALDLAFQLLNLSEDDEVILPSFAIISCLSAIIRANAKPVFCDVSKDSWNMTLEDVQKKVTKKTKVVLIVHLYGLTAEADKIQDFCSINNITLIEDAAEAHGQFVGNKQCGSFGLISTMSFYANKHVTTGEGGLLLTDDVKLKEKADNIRNLGFNSERRFQHSDLYWNYRMGGLQAALGISQLKSLENNIQNKIKQGNYYQSNLSSLREKIQLPMISNNGSLNHYWVFGIVLLKKDIRENIVLKLSESGIQTRPFFWPLHLQEVLRKYDLADQDNLPVSENIGKNGFYIPIGNHLSKTKQNFVIDNLIKIINEYS